MNKILVFGKNGQVGSKLTELLGDDCISLDRNDVDLTNLEALKKFLHDLKEVPSAIIDAAAYTAVDAAEGEGKELNYILNSDAPVVMAEYCKEKNIPFIYYTTDYVFDGSGSEPFTEDNIKNLNPLSEYGKSKLEAEKRIQEIGGKFLIFRISWLYSEIGKNFVHTMIKLASDRDELSIINDQIGSPTYACDVARRTITVLDKARKMEEFPSGIYHMVNAGYNSWYDFAIEIFKLARENDVKLKIEDVNPIETKQYPTPAKRPLNSRLDTSKIRDVFGIELRHWKGALKECIEKIYNK